MGNKLAKPQQQNNVIVVDDGNKVYDIVNKRGKCRKIQNKLSK